MIEITDHGPVAPARSRGRVVVLAIGIVVVVLAGVFVAVGLSNGGNTPTDPVREMVDAAQHGDALGVLEQLDPGERDAARGPLTDLVKELNRIGVLKDASLSNISGVTIKVDDLKLTSSDVRNGLARVRIDGGKSNVSVDPAKLPLGKFVRDIAGDSLDKAKPTSESSDLKSKEANDFVVVVRHGGRWYVSVNYTVAEQAREDRHVSLQDLGDGVAAHGAASPQDAVRDLITAGVNLDVRRLVELMPPDELPALHEYAGLFIDQADKSVADVKKSYTVAIPTLELTSDTSGSHSLVKVTKLELSAKAGETSVSYKNGCADITTPGGESQHICQGTNPTDMLKQFGLGSALKPPDFSFTGKHPDIGFVTTKVDGKWYVSPTRTVLEDVVAFVRLVQPSDLDKGRDWFKQFTQDMTSRAQRSCLSVSGQLNGSTPPSTSLSCDGGDR